MELGLNEEQLSVSRECFANNKKVDAAILYGSRAKGNHQKGSDIDIVLMGDQLNIKDLFNIEIVLEETLFPCKIDLSIHHYIKETALFILTKKDHT